MIMGPSSFATLVASRVIFGFSATLSSTFGTHLSSSHTPRMLVNWVTKDPILVDPKH